MEIAYGTKALEDIDYWKKSGNKKIQERISLLIEDIQQHPFTGIGKPEPLKHDLSGKWSRRIDKGNRIVYGIKGNYIFIYTIRGHY
jgi:toxin YoeB